MKEKEFVKQFLLLVAALLIGPLATQVSYVWIEGKNLPILTRALLSMAALVIAVAILGLIFWQVRSMYAKDATEEQKKNNNLNELVDLLRRLVQSMEDGKID